MLGMTFLYPTHPSHHIVSADHMFVQFLLITNNTIISVEYATGYIADTWDDRMRILVSITSCGTLLNQAWSKTAFGVTLLRLSEKWQRWVLCFCIATMNIYAIIKVFLQWGKVCESESSDVWWRLDFCTSDDVRDQIKEGGNGESLGCSHRDP